MSLPKLVVFDLDYTLWPFWCDTHVVPPVREVDGQSVSDRHGDRFSFYRGVPEVLHDIRALGTLKICAASRTSSPRIAQQLLSLLQIDGEPSSNLFLYTAWGTGSKVGHLEELRRVTGVEYADMVLFDDEARNRDVERKLGVTFVEVPNGLSRDLFSRGIDAWREHHEENRDNAALARQRAMAGPVTRPPPPPKPRPKKSFEKFVLPRDPDAAAKEDA